VHAKFLVSSCIASLNAAGPARGFLHGSCSIPRETMTCKWHAISLSPFNCSVVTGFNCATFIRRMKSLQLATNRRINVAATETTTSDRSRNQCDAANQLQCILWLLPDQTLSKLRTACITRLRHTVDKHLPFSFLLSRRWPPPASQARFLVPPAFDSALFKYARRWRSSRGVATDSPPFVKYREIAAWI